MTTVLPGVVLVLPVPRPAPSPGSHVPIPEPDPTPASPAQAPAPAPDRVPAAEPAPLDAPRRPGRKPAGRLGELLLTAAALLGVCVTGVTGFAATTGLKPLVVKSGSMEPTIATGAMVLVRTIPAADIEVGDVVAVERPDRTRVMHRVLEVTQQGATAQLVLKGDANEDPDPVPVTVTEAGELVFSTPVVGRVSAFLASAKGGFALGSLVTAVLMSVLRRRS